MYMGKQERADIALEEKIESVCVGWTQIQQYSNKEYFRYGKNRKRLYRSLMEPNKVKLMGSRVVDGIQSRLGIC